MPRLSLGIILALAVSTTATGAIASTQYQSSTTNVSSDILISEKQSAPSGQFVAVEHPTQGQVSIIEEDGNRYLELSSDFQTDEGPDLKVILHDADTVDLKVEEGSYVSLGALSSFSGAQRYLIPEDVDLNQYQSVAIWCEQFNATFGYAPLAVSTEN
ncbi:DM13 domain-containing protein [Myxosarcina sp. GI1(2024)]